MIVQKELEVVLQGPIGPQRLHDDTIVIDKDGWYIMLTPSCASCSSNEVLFSNLDSENPDAQIDATIAKYHQIGLPLSWCVYPWTQPMDLGKRLEARGATKSTVKAMLVSTAIPLKEVDGVTVDRVEPESEESFDAYMKVLNDRYKLLPSEEAFRRHRYRQLIQNPNPQMHLFLGKYKGKLAGCAGMIIKQNSAHLTTASVLREFEGRGIFPSLSATILRKLRELGIRFASCHANEGSAPWVELFGGKVVYSYNIFQLDLPADIG